MKIRLSYLCISAVVCCAFLLGPPANMDASAGEVTDQVKQTVDKVIDTLKNKDLKKASKMSERRALLRKIVYNRFDFEEMAKRSLAIHWQKRSPAEKKDFVQLYSDLLERSYVNKIESYNNEKIVYEDESIDGEFATVKTMIITSKNVEVPVVYKLMKKNSKWVVYDVIIEEVSLVGNYRTQFNKIIRSKSYDELVRRMKNKQAEEKFSEDL